MNATQSKQTQHTPGPWTWRDMNVATSCPVALDGPNGYVMHAHVDVQPDGTLRACIDFHSEDNEFQLGLQGVENNPNARLIAAAPDLLNALTALANVAEARGIPVDAARAAIAKATA